MDVIQTLLAVEDLKKLKTLLLEQKNVSEVREALIAAFLKYADYKCVSDWNKAVRLCECLAIIGWGKYEALEALKGQYFNGNPETYFLTKDGEARFVTAIWSKRATGYTMEAGRTSYFESPNQLDDKKDIISDCPIVERIEDLKFESQRNWIPKFPIRFDRVMGNCYKNSAPVIFSISKELQEMLNEKMQPENYGSVINYITIDLAFSHDVVNSYPLTNINCKENYIISNQEEKLSIEEAHAKLKKMFSKKEIEENKYYLVNRFVYSPFRSTTGKMDVQIYFEKEFSMLDYQKQKQKFTEYVLLGLNTAIEKLKKKKVAYDFDLMMHDFTQIINQWKEAQITEELINRAIKRYEE
jgi:hypothetical protein